jgi:hypothetical protein
VKRYRAVVVLAMLLAALSCAKKMLPPSPDRFRPNLLEVDTKTRSQVELVFDEEIDGNKLQPDSFVMTGAAGDTVKLLGVSSGRQSDRVLLWTPIQSAGLYELRGRVQDRAGNPTRFRARFRGSTRQDTIAPRVTRITPGPATTSMKRAVTIRVDFSEAVDTAGKVDYMLVPSDLDTLFTKAWSTDWQQMGLVYRDSLPVSGIVYVLIQPGVRDLEGNRSRGPAFTYFTPDTVFEAAPVRGRARHKAGLLGTGTVYFQQERTAGIAPVLSDGSFSTRLKKGEYRVIAAADTNGDGVADLSSPEQGFNTDAESLDIELGPESIPRPYNAYRR